MRCKTMEEVDALCRRFDPLAEEFVKMANVIPDSSSSNVEDGASSDDFADGSE